jgi:hypothetical protein
MEKNEFHETIFAFSAITTLLVEALVRSGAVTRAEIVQSLQGLAGEVPKGSASCQIFESIAKTLEKHDAMQGWKSKAPVFTMMTGGADQGRDSG